jgi:translation elongation factor EF-Ts
VNVQRVYVPQEFSYLQSSGYTKQPMFYKTSKEVPYLLGETVIAIQETKPVTLEFTMTTIPQQLSLFKQSGYEPEVVRVIVTRANNSLISEQLLREQEFVLEGDKWVKTIVRNEDVTVRLTE